MDLTVAIQSGKLDDVKAAVSKLETTNYIALKGGTPLGGATGNFWSQSVLIPTSKMLAEYLQLILRETEVMYAFLNTC